MELSFEDFEYAGYFASKYCKPIVYDGCKNVEQEAKQHAWSIYKGWYTKSFSELKNQYEKYNANLEIQEKISILGLNSYKFWVLLLFIRDLVNAAISPHLVFNPTIRQEAASIKDFLDIDPENLSIRKKGKELKITHLSIVRSIQNLMDIIVSADSDNLDFTDLKGVSEKKDVHRIKKMTELLSEFLDPKVPSRLFGKMSFIGKMLYLVDFVDSEDYFTGKHITEQLTEINSWKIKTGKAELITVNNKQYLYEPFDVGKDLADTIKKCTICDFNCSITSLFYDPGC